MLFQKKLNKIIKYGLYLLVFLLPIQTRWIIKAGELNEYGTISLYGTDILLILLLFLFVIFKFQSQITNTTTHCHCERSETERSNPAASRDIHGIASSLHSSRLGGIRSVPRNDSELLFSKIWWLIAGLELIIFISIFFAPDKLVAVYGYARFLLGVGLFWLIVSANYNKIKLVYSLLAGIFLQACLGVWQFLTQSSFACKWLGMAQHNAGDLGVSVVETISSVDGIAERWLRAYGGLDHPNVLGGLLVVGLLLVVGSIIKNTRMHFNNQDTRYRNIRYKDTRNKIQTNSKFQIPITKQFGYWNLEFVWNLYLVSCIFVFISALFFTFSRGAWLGLIVGLAMMLLIAAVKKNLAVQKKILEIILISGILIFILFNQFQDLVMTRVSADARLEVKSSIERIESYKDSWELIKNNWLFGVGVGNYVKYNANLRIYANTANLNYTNKNTFIQPVHNVFLLVWAEIGIIGLLFFISLLLCVMRYALCDRTRLRGNSLNIKLSLLIALSVMFLVDHWWWSLHFGIFLFWLVLGLVLKKDKQ